MQLGFPQSILSLNGDFLFISDNFLGYRLLNYLATLFIFCPVFTSHLVELGLFLAQLNVQFVLNLKDLAFLMLLQVSLVMIDIGAMLFAQLLEAALKILFCVLLNLGDVSCQLLLCTLDFIKLIILDLSLLLADLDLLVKGLLDVHKAILLLLLHLEPVIIKLIHDPSLHLLRFKLQVFPDKLLLLK